MSAVEPSQRRLIVISGLVAALGALIVGIGEFTFQYSQAGGYDGDAYRFFLAVSSWRLTFGHFLSVLAAPLYLIGYWHVGQMMRPAGQLLSASIFGFGAYAFAIGNVWLGGRVNIALVVQAAERAPSDAQPLFGQLLADVAQHNEPFIWVVRLLILIVSVLMAFGILSGRSHYPRIMVVLLPAVLLAAIFAGYRYAPEVGAFLLPAAMNVAHFIFFVGSALVASRMSAHTTNQTGS